MIYIRDMWKTHILFFELRVESLWFGSCRLLPLKGPTWRSGKYHLDRIIFFSGKCPPIVRYRNQSSESTPPDFVSLHRQNETAEELFEIRVDWVFRAVQNDKWASSNDELSQLKNAIFEILIFILPRRIFAIEPRTCHIAPIRASCREGWSRR